MLAEAIRQALGAWPAATLVGSQANVPTHCLYPSNSIVTVSVEAPGDMFVVHDRGGALDELAAAGGDPARSSRHILFAAARAQGLKVDDLGRIFAPPVQGDMLATAIVLVANASKEAAQQLVNKFHPATRRDFHRAVEDLLSIQFPNRWKKQAQIVGQSNKPHRFDYMIELTGHRELVMDAVVPDSNSINAAVVAHMDVRQANLGGIVQRIVFDDDVKWNSADLALLSVGAPPVPFSVARDVLSSLAANGARPS